MYSLDNLDALEVDCSFFFPPSLMGTNLIKNKTNKSKQMIYMWREKKHCENEIRFVSFLTYDNNELGALALMHSCHNHECTLKHNTRNRTKFVSRNLSDNGRCEMLVKVINAISTRSTKRIMILFVHQFINKEKMNRYSLYVGVGST